MPDLLTSNIALHPMPPEDIFSALPPYTLRRALTPRGQGSNPGGQGLTIVLGQVGRAEYVHIFAWRIRGGGEGLGLFFF